MEVEDCQGGGKIYPGEMSDTMTKSWLGERLRQAPWRSRTAMMEGKIYTGEMSDTMTRSWPQSEASVM